MKNYMIIRAYNDQTSITEHGNDIGAILCACAIYLQDPDCFVVKVIDVDNDKIIVDVVR